MGSSIRPGVTTTRNVHTSNGRTSYRQSTEPHAQDYFFWMTRDSQRSKLYAAETSFGWGENDGLPKWDVQDLGPLDVANLIAEIEASDLLAEYTTHPKYFTPQIKMKGRSTGGDYCPKDGIGTGATTHPYIILHEWAHHATTLLLGDIHQPHGPEYARALLDVVHAILGNDAGHSLRQHFNAKKVKVASLALDFVPRMFGGPRSRQTGIKG